MLLPSQTCAAAILDILTFQDDVLAVLRGFFQALLQGRQGTLGQSGAQKAVPAMDLEALKDRLRQQPLLPARGLKQSSKGDSRIGGH